MYNIKYTQMSETYVLSALLAVVGGYLDAYTYIERGNVFANAQTGNIILLGMNLARENWTKALCYIVPILAFVLGVFVSEVIKIKFKQNSNIHWRQIIVVIEIISLTIVAFIPHGRMDVISNTVVSFVCSLQFDSFNKFTTTMCTGNLRTATEKLFSYKHIQDYEEKVKSLQYYGIILFFIIGVILGSIFTKFFVEKAILFSCIILIIVFGMMFIKEDTIT